MSKAHLNSILPLEGIPARLDDATYTYMNFNNNLVGTINPTYPIINNNNIIYEEDSFEPIISEGKFGNGISIDEATYNIADTIIKRTPFLHGSYNHQGLKSSPAPEKGPGWFKFQISKRGTNHRILQFPYIAQQPDEIITYSLQFDFGKTEGYYWALDGSGGGGVQTTIDDRWINVRTNGQSNVNIAAFLMNQTYNVDVDDTIYYKNYQVERKKYATSFIEGTRNPSYLTYSIDTDPKTISFWFKSNSNKKAGRLNQRTLMVLSDDFGTGSVPYMECLLSSEDDFRFGYTSNKVSLTIRTPVDSYYCYIDSIDGSDGEWHHVVVELNKDRKGILHVDTIKAETPQYPSETSFGNTLRIGHPYMPTSNSEVFEGMANCSFDELCIRTEHYSEKEISQWFYSDREFYNPYDYSLTV